MTQRILIVAGLLFILSAVALFATGYPVAQNAGPTPAPTPTQFVTWLVCADCAETGMEINVWTHPDRSGIAGKFPHRTLVTVIDSTVWRDLTYYKVQAQDVTGWVSFQMLLEP